MAERSSRSLYSFCKLHSLDIIKHIKNKTTLIMCYNKIMIPVLIFNEDIVLCFILLIFCVISIANYLYELAQGFSRFYENCQVSGSKEEQEHLKLVKIYLDTMAHGFNILGIEIPEEM